MVALRVTDVAFSQRVIKAVIIDVGRKFLSRARIALIKLAVFVARSGMSSIHETLSSLVVVM